MAHGDFVVLLNSDTVLEDDSLLRCMAWMQAHPHVGAATPSLIGMDNVPQECVHAYPTLKNKLRMVFRLAQPPVEERSTADGWLAGTALILRREALQQVEGRLDDGFFMYWEDADISARLREKGWKLAVVPEAHIRQYGGASGGGIDARRRPDLEAWYVYGMHRWYAKHRPVWERIVLWCLHLSDALRQYLRGLLRPARRHEWGHARALIGVLWGRLVGAAPPVPARRS